MKELSQREIDEFYAAQEREKKPVKSKPRIMTPEEVRGGSATEPEESTTGQWPEHESITLERQKRVSKWEEGVYPVVVERVWTSEGKDFYHTDENGEPNSTTFIHIGFLTGDGMRIQKRMTLNYNERSTLSAMLTAIFGTPPESINTDELVGQKLRILVKNVVNNRGDEWESITEFLSSTSKFKTGGQT